MIRGAMKLSGILLCLLTGVASAEFTDDFSAPATSNTNWVKSSDKLTVEYENGVCRLNNSDPDYAAFVYHTFPADKKPATFTLSAEITIDGNEKSAGFVFCMSVTTVVTGYFVSIQKGNLVVVNTFEENGGEVLFTKKSPYLTAGMNILALSKKDSVFNIICNGHFLGTFTDKRFASGDIALSVGNEALAVFDNVSLVDSFTPATELTCFSDNFNDDDLLGWEQFGSDEASISAENEALHVVTGGGQSVYQQFSIPLSDFILQITVSHRRGSSTQMYGLFLSGVASESGGSIPVAIFGIAARRTFGVFSDSAYIPQSHPSIRGAAYVSGSGDTTYYLDTLTVIKRDGSDEYVFKVNADTMTKFTDVKFEITGAGIFCAESLDIICDDFLLAKGPGFECPVVSEPIRTIRHGTSALHPAIRAVDAYIFDCAGRLVSRGGAAGSRQVVPGMYLTRERKKILYRTR